MRRTWTVALLGVLLASGPLAAADPLHRQIDALILAGGKGKPVSAPGEDEFLRRPGTGQHHDAPVPLPVPERGEQRPAERREPYAARHD